MLPKLLRILSNRYLIASVAFIIWVSFFDNYSLVRQLSLKKQLNSVEEMEQHYRNEISKNRTELKELVTNKKTLEKFAREKYMMKRDNEDIFVVVKE